MNDLVTSEVKTTSKIIADYFCKAHRDVVRAIRNLECSDDFKVRNYAHCEFINDKGVMYEGFEITKDGFSMLCMGFTGSKAAAWKEKFIAAFNSMEAALHKNSNGIEWKAARLQGKAIRKANTDIIKEFVEYASTQGSKNARMYYANITKMEYKALDMLEQSKSATCNFRDTLDILQIGYLQVAETIASKAIEKGMQDDMHYKEIYIFAKQRVSEYAESISWARLN